MFGKHLYATGLILGSPIEEFDPSIPFTYCRICGRVYQVHNLPENQAVVMRKDWSQRHARSHPEKLHKQLMQSGLWLFPEAARHLAAFGVIPVSDMIVNAEVQAALLESKPDINGGFEYAAL